MATLRKKQKWKLATMARETQEYSRNNQVQNSAAPGITENYMAQVSEEIEGRVTNKLSQDFRQDRIPHRGCTVQVKRISLEPTGTDILQNRSGNILERRRRTPGTKRGSFPE